MSVLPPRLPPRRVPPPPPPRRIVSESQIDSTPLPGVAARIASLQLNNNNRPPPTRPPPLPRARTQPQVSVKTEEIVREAAEGDQEEKEDHVVHIVSSPPPPLPPRSMRPKTPAIRDPTLAKALARVPPPPPTAARPVPNIPQPPARRLPPMSTRLPTPPPEPDHPPFGAGDTCLKCTNFAHVDAHAALFPRTAGRTIPALAHALTAPFPSETEKARAIFTWLHHNIAYDAVSFLAGTVRPATPQATLVSGLAVCSGYAGLFKALADAAGLEAVEITGHGKGVGYVALGPADATPAMSSNHAWNAVRMDGTWRLVDATWGAGALDGAAYSKRFTPMWFNATAAEFGERHFPVDPTDQLMGEEDGGAVDWETYIRAPEGPVLFGEFHRLEYLRGSVQPAVPCLAGGRRYVFQLRKSCEHMSTEERDNYVVFVQCGEERTVLERDMGEGGWSASVYVPRGDVEGVGLYFVTQVGGRDAYGLGVKGFWAAFGRQEMAFGGLCRWTVE